MNDTLKYTGYIEVDYIYKDSLVKTKKIHNRGRYILFNTLVNMLDNRFEPNTLPKYIQFYSLPLETVPEITNENNFPYVSDTVDALLSNAPAYDYTEVINTSKEVNTSSITYNFSIPLLLLTDTSKEINMLALFNSVKLNTTEPSASAFIVSEADKTVLVDLLEDISDFDNYVLNIRWKLEFSN